MISVNYANAMAEVLEYLKGIKEEDLRKISPKFINFLVENSSKDYKPNIDFTKPLSELKVSENTKAIITFICYKYWCDTEDGKKLLVEVLGNNEKEWEYKINKRVDFRQLEVEKHINSPKSQNDSNEENLNLAISNTKKINIFQRIAKFIKNKLKRG